MKTSILLKLKLILILVIANCFVFIQAQTIEWDHNINLSDDENTGDIVFDIIQANNKIFVYSAKEILVYDALNNDLIDEINLPGYYGKFNPIYFHYSIYVCDINVMAFNQADNYLYVVTPELSIIGIDISGPPPYSYNYNPPLKLRPSAIDHFQTLNGFTVIKYDHINDRLYWLVEGRNDTVNVLGNFHTRDTYLAIYTVDPGGYVLTDYYEEFVQGTGPTYNNTASDVEYNHSNDNFYIARKKKIQVYDFNDPGNPILTINTVPGKFGKLLYINETNIHKVIALPYRLPFDCGGLCEPPMATDVGFYVIDGNNNNFDAVLAPSKRILDAVYLPQQQDLVLCYSPDNIFIQTSTVPISSDIAIYHYNGTTFTLSQDDVLVTNTPPLSTYYNSRFDRNMPLKLLKETENSVIVSKTHEIIRVYDNNGQYEFTQLLRGDGNIFYSGEQVAGKSYVLNIVSSGLEVFENQAYSKSIRTGYPVYHITPNPLERKLYFFNKLHTYNAGLYVYDMENETLININRDGDQTNDIEKAIGDCVYNPYTNHFLVSENAPADDNGKIKIKVYNGDDNTLFQTIEIDDPDALGFPKEMFIAPNERLYVMTNMHEGFSPKIFVYDANDYQEITQITLTMPIYYPEFYYYVAHFCYVPQNQSVYATIMPNDTALYPYYTVPNTMLGSALLPNGKIVQISDGQIIDEHTLKCPGEMICPDAENPGNSIYNGTLFINGQTLMIFNYEEAFSSVNPIILDYKLNDITYSSYHDKIFGFADEEGNNGSGDREIKIYSIDPDGTAHQLNTSDYCHGEAAGIFANSYDGLLYLYKKIDNYKLGGEQAALLQFDPALYPNNIFKDSVQLRNTSFFPDYVHNMDARFFFCNLTTPYIDPYDTVIYMPNGGHSNVSVVAFEPNEPLLLNNGEWAWLSFPRMERDGNDPVIVDDVLGGDRIEPGDYIINSQLINRPLESYYNKSNTYDGSFWDGSQGLLLGVQSTLGYKLKLLYENPQPDDKWLHLSGSVFSPSTTTDLPNLYTKAPGNEEYYENWIGYYLYHGQSPFDAISDEDLEHIYSIKSQYWACNKLWGEGIPEPYWICACHQGNCVRVNYGDMVVMKTYQQINNFQWQDYGMTPGGNEERAETENFTFTEQADYTPIFIELDSTVNPLEIGAFVEDSCIGATTILPEDTVVMVPSYTEGISGEIYFETYYGSNKSYVSPIKKYWVRNNKTYEREHRAIHTMERQDYYLVSFKNHEQETDNGAPVDLWLSCVPNPLSDHCIIRYHIPKSSHVQVVIYDLYGRTISILQEGILDAGTYQITFDGRDSTGKQLENGTYIVSIKAGEYKAQAKLIIIK